MKTPHLELILTPEEEWGSKKYKDFIKELAGTEETSTLQIIDKVVGELRSSLSSMEDQLSII